MGKPIRTIFNIDTFSLTECTDGYWLYDTVVGMNLAMRAKTEQDAYIEALLYYQKRLAKVKTDYNNLDDKVQTFVSQFLNEDEDGFISTDIW
jgi:hypothetical protein